MAKNVYTGPRSFGARRKIVRTNFSENDLARISASDATQDLTGRAIHEIGMNIAGEKIGGKFKKKKAEEKKPDPLEEPLDEDIFKELGGGLDIEDVEYIEEPLDDLDDLILRTPDKVQSVIKPKGIVMPETSITADMGLPSIIPGSSFTEPYPTFIPTTQTRTTGGASFGLSTGTQSINTAGVEGYTLDYDPRKDPTLNHLILEDSPVNRLDPEMERLSEGDSVYGVGTGQSFAAGLNVVKKARNYERQVWENKRKNTEDKFGDLMSTPEGEDPNITSQLKAYSTEILEEWKELRNNRMDMDDADYVAAEQELLNRSKNIKSFREKLLEGTNTYLQNKDNISVSTPGSTIDFYETIANNKGDLKLETVNGVLTLNGKTQAGENVSFPAHQVINGENVFRFNTKVDIYSQVLDPISKQLEKYKTDKSINFGISKEMIPFSELEPQIDTFLNSYLKDRTNVQSVLGDGYGYTYSQQIESEKSGVNLKEQAKKALKEDIQKMLNPAYAQKDIQADPRASARLSQQRLSIAQQKAKSAKGSGKGLSDYSSAAADILSGAQETELETLVQVNGGDISSKKQLYNTYPNLKKIEGAKGVGKVDYDKGVLTVYGPQEVTEVEQDGATKSTRKTKVLANIDLTGSYDQALQNIANLLQQTNYKQASNPSALDQFSNFIESE